MDLAFDDDIDGSKDRAIRRATFTQWAKGVTEDLMLTAQLEIREVTVERVNGTGFKADGSWFNVSKFARAADVPMPRAGDLVVVSLDRSGFVRKVEPVPQPVPVATPSAVLTPETATPPPSAPTIQQDDRGVVVTRLATLNTATAILGSGGQAASADEVLALAARLEAWATR